MEEEDEHKNDFGLGDLHRVGLIIAMGVIVLMLYYQIVFG